MAMNGEIWVDLSCNLTHSGTYDFKGAMLKTIERGIKNSDDEKKEKQMTDQSKQVSLEDKLKSLLQNPQMKDKLIEGSGSEKKEVSIEEKLKALLNRNGGDNKMNKVQIV
jgi:hypothetical protein